MPALLPANLRVVCYDASAADAAWRATLEVPVALWLDTPDPLVALREAAARERGADVLLVRAGVASGPRAFARLLAAAAASDALVVSALDTARPELSPLQEGAAAQVPDALAADSACHLLGTRCALPTPHWSPLFALWRRAALERLDAVALQGPLPDDVPGAVFDGLFVALPGTTLDAPPGPADPREPPPASPLAILRARFATVAPPAWPGLDRRPVVLHVLHGWGGGADAFVRDLAAADTPATHLALVARGTTARRTYGEVLELIAPGRDAPVLRRTPLARPVAATALEHAEYRAILADVVRDFAVDAVLVSSLIGHSLDALRTGRPTGVVCHDYYPLWPILHCDFGDATRRFDAAELDAELARRPAGMPFAGRDARTWLALREAYLDALAGAQARLATPTAGVKANLERIAPRLGALGITVIEHGLRPFACSAGPATGRPPRARPRVLVLGRIAGGKGEQLLAKLVPKLADDVDFHLLGCGAAGEAFFGRSGVHIELDYARDALPAALARIAPDLALLPATVAETYSYTLSELRALGVPVLATALGSLAERIEDGATGFLVAPDADAVAARVRALLADRAALDAVGARSRALVPRTTEAMAHDYHALLDLPALVDARPRVAAFSPLLQAWADAETLRYRAARRAAAQADALAKQQTELEARADWAYRMERQFRERARWAEQLDATLAQVRAAHAQTADALARLEKEFDERTAWALALDRQREGLEQERGVMLNSLSWKLTKPVRHAGRTLRALRLRVGFQAQRLRAIVGRVRLSLRQRGLAGTVRRALEGRRTTAAVEPPSVPGDEPFAAFGIPAHERPRVSIVIPVYNQFRHTLTCLRSIAQHPGTVPFEVVVVDDCSSDETPDRLQEIGGILALRNPQNLGFIGACNAGAASAKGEFVLFLNNDTAIQPGWLEALCATFDARPDCGLAGAKLVYPDGRLQEAGGIVFADASGWNYGRFDDPADPAYNYVREADYCSGAAIMIRRELFERFGGFDTHYRPAYYEDTDLAFRVRDAGLKVYYQPASTVVHFEGVTSGTDTSSGTKRYQVVNQAKFAERWRDALARQPKPGTPIAIAREHRVRRRVLVIDATTPTPDQDSGSVRLVNVFRVLASLGWKATFFADNRAYVPGYTAALQQLGVEALYHPWLSDPVAWLEKNGRLLDAVVLCRHYVAAPYVPLLRRYAPQARIVFDTVDLHYLREERAAALEDSSELRRAALATKAAELKLVRACDVTTVVSPVEQEILKLACPGSRIEILSNVHEVTGRRRDFAARRDVWFVGGFQHTPNVDAVRWFVADVWPLVAGRLPDARFHIVGSRMPEEIRTLAGERIVAHGHVASLDEFLDGCRLSVAPLRYGAGVKGKVNQSMAHGQPVVATPIAVEGMHLVDGAEALVAESAQDFAAGIVRAYTDEALWQKLSQGGLANVERHFSFDTAREALKRILPA